MNKLIPALMIGALAAAVPALAQESDPLRAQLSAPVSRTAFPEMTTGEAVYKGICQGCHMPDAKGAVGAGAYPALASDERLGTAEYPIMVVLAGQKAMPSFGGLLSDAQVAGVVGYLRTNYGNRYRAPVTPQAVLEVRKALN